MPSTNQKTELLTKYLPTDFPRIFNAQRSKLIHVSRLPVFLTYVVLENEQILFKTWRI